MGKCLEDAGGVLSLLTPPIYILWDSQRKKINTEENANVVDDVCGIEFIRFLAVLDIVK